MAQATLQAWEFTDAISPPAQRPIVSNGPAAYLKIRTSSQPILPASITPRLETNGIRLNEGKPVCALSGCAYEDSVLLLPPIRNLRRSVIENCLTWSLDSNVGSIKLTVTDDSTDPGGLATPSETYWAAR